MSTQQTTIAWYYQDSALARTNSVDEMLEVMRKSNYPVPNEKKMRSELETLNRFTYGVGQFKVIQEIN